mmetsp:Transcript_69305/g.224017  ORF Transcript_69305/g.224017 Transcript_69305/m.224017 type:complete len:414 (-) Transcript_69305:87-1328(-)
MQAVLVGEDRRGAEGAELENLQGHGEGLAEPAVARGRGHHEEVVRDLVDERGEEVEEGKLTADDPAQGLEAGVPGEGPLAHLVEVEEGGGRRERGADGSVQRPSGLLRRDVILGLGAMVRQVVAPPVAVGAAPGYTHGDVGRGAGEGLAEDAVGTVAEVLLHDEDVHQEHPAHLDEERQGQDHELPLGHELPAPEPADERQLREDACTLREHDQNKVGGAPQCGPGRQRRHVLQIPETLGAEVVVPLVAQVAIDEVLGAALRASRQARRDGQPLGPAVARARVAPVAALAQVVHVLHDAEDEDEEPEAEEDALHHGPLRLGDDPAALQDRLLLRRPLRGAGRLLAERGLAVFQQHGRAAEGAAEEPLRAGLAEVVVAARSQACPAWSVHADGAEVDLLVRCIAVHGGHGRRRS